MPFLDVSDIVLDPDFADTLVLERTVQTTGDDGFPVSATTKSSIIGVVTSSSGDRLNRSDAGRRRSGSITVHTKTRLVAGLGPIDADMLTYRGQRYTVTSVNDYSAYGAGFIAAECELAPLT